MSRKIHRAAAAVAVVCGVGAGVLGVASWQNSARAESRVAPAQRTATVDMYGLIERSIDSDKYKPAREAHHNELRARLDAIQKELEGTQTALRAMEQAKPEFQAEYAKFQARVQEFQQLQEESAQKAETFNTQQLLESYKLIVDSVNQLAKERGYTHVVATRDMSIEIRPTNLQGALQEILARPMVVSATEDDLTEAVATAMKLPAPKPPEPATPGATEPAPAQPAAPAAEEPKK
jgi:Skp family chaperone for outer membrane proteins